MSSHADSLAPGSHRIVVLTDIDGTLLDHHTYEAGAAEPVVRTLVARGVPLVLCSSKTFAEQEHLRRHLGIPDPFIVENGGAIIVPRGYFRGPGIALGQLKSVPGYEFVELGTPVEQIRSALRQLGRELGLALVGYGDLTDQEVADVTGLDLDGAARARCRAYSETIVTPLETRELAALLRGLGSYGLSASSGGRFLTVTTASADKGTAASHLLSLFQTEQSTVTSIGIGDSANDAPLLAVVDEAYVVQRADGTWQDFPGIEPIYIGKRGPEGWADVIHDLMAKTSGHT